MLDDDACYEACSGRETRWDGHFVLAVTSTGIYCRPSCPAAKPRRENCRFFPTAAAAVAAGYRACRRCRPDALPGSGRWDAHASLAGRAVRAIRDGAIDEVGVAGLAYQLGVSERQLHRLLIAEVGASPSQLNRTRRAHLARTLLDQTSMSVTEVAFASGFGSVRQFNDVFRAEFGTSPTRLRGRPGEARRESDDALTLTLRLPFREPYAAPALRAALAAHAVPGLESVEADAHRRLVQTASGPAQAVVRWGVGAVSAHLTLPSFDAVTPVVARLRRWLDLDADPEIIDAHLSRSGLLAPLVGQRPGLRVPGVIDAAEFALFVVLGQQISLAAARTVQARLVASLGVEPTALAEAGPERIREQLRLTRAKAATVHALAEALAGGLRLTPDADRVEARSRLLAIRGIGEWTAEFIAMRAVGDPDACPASDLVLRRALGGVPTRDVARAADPWRPWRAYGVMHLWTKESYR